MPLRQRLSEAVASALASAEVKEAFAKIGAKAEPATPEGAVFLHRTAAAALVSHRGGDRDFGRRVMCRKSKAGTRSQGSKLQCPSPVFANSFRKWEGLPLRKDA